MEDLQVKKLSFAYTDNNIVLDDVSFDVSRGDFVALAGPNGAGKTTLIKIILGLEKNQQGEIKILNGDFKKNTPWSKIGYLPQRINNFNQLFPATVKEIIALGLLSQKKYPKRISELDQKKIQETLNLLDIADLEKKSINKLSGGQQQRVFLARALVSNPQFLIMDEPSNALDPKMRDSFFKLIKKLNQEKGITIIMITHDTAQVGKYANKLLYLDKKVIFFGKFTDFCHSPKMEQYFGHFAQHLICHQH